MRPVKKIENAFASRSRMERDISNIPTDFDSLGQNNLILSENSSKITKHF
jgi:hypothetical protein